MIRSASQHMDIEKRIEKYEKLLQNLTEKSGEGFGREQKLLIVSALRKAYREGRLIRLLKEWDLLSNIEDPDLLMREMIATLYSLVKDGLNLSDEEAGEAVLYILNLRETPPLSLTSE